MKEVSVWLDMDGMREGGFRSEFNMYYLDGWVVRGVID